LGLYSLPKMLNVVEMQDSDSSSSTSTHIIVDGN